MRTVTEQLAIGVDESQLCVPGCRPERLARLARTAVQRCQLDLTDLVVFTEAASGAYAVTPVLAALAGARRVYALAPSSESGSFEEIKQATDALARIASVGDRIEVVSEKCRDIICQADIVTNSGHVRPIDAEMVAAMKFSAVIPLMYEAWELRTTDLDLTACRERGIPIAGTNEQHPEIDTFSFLGMMSIRLLLDAGIPVSQSRILVCSDNLFGPFLERGLSQSGAIVESVENLAARCGIWEADAVVIAMVPREQPVVGRREAELIAQFYPAAVVAQFWGDLDRFELRRCNVPFWPIQAPRPGHQAALPSSIGPDPVVRLQAGGLKVGEVMARSRLSQSNLKRVRPPRLPQP